MGVIIYETNYKVKTRYPQPKLLCWFTHDTVFPWTDWALRLPKTLWQPKPLCKTCQKKNEIENTKHQL